MPKFLEVYGVAPSSLTPTAGAQVRSVACPFSEANCDGGGNRHQTNIKLTEHHQLRPYFDASVEKVLPAVCSINYPDKNQKWVVCPRRLLGFQSQTKIPHVNEGLQPHERDTLIACGLPRGVELGVWPEVYLQYSDEEADINYHFDFIIAPLVKNQSMRDCLRIIGIDDVELAADCIKIGRKGGLVTGRINPDTDLPLLPDLRAPYIFEVMTASTSGSDKAKGNDIASAFTNVILGKDHESPGINKRQVWGRMATQLFAKTALASEWNGRTIWVVQDELLTNIERTTKMDLSKEAVSSNQNICFAVLAYQRDSNGLEEIHFKELREGPAGISFQGDGTCADILLPKVNPSKFSLMQAIMRRELAGILRL